MSGDGVSLQTNLVQLGNVAKTTARSTQVPHGANPGSEPADRREVAKLTRVNEAEKAERQQVDPDRRRERERRQSAHEGTHAAADPTDADAAPSPEEDAEHAAGLGGLFDRKA